MDRQAPGARGAERRRPWRMGSVAAIGTSLVAATVAAIAAIIVGVISRMDAGDLAGAFHASVAIAQGDIAVGLVAMGNRMSFGVVAIGGDLAIGLVSFGTVALGGISFGLIPLLAVVPVGLLTLKGIYTLTALYIEPPMRQAYTGISLMLLRPFMRFLVEAHMAQLHAHVRAGNEVPALDAETMRGALALLTEIEQTVATGHAMVHPDRVTTRVRRPSERAPRPRAPRSRFGAYARLGGRDDRASTEMDVLDDGMDGDADDDYDTGARPASTAAPTGTAADDAVSSVDDYDDDDGDDGNETPVDGTLRPAPPVHATANAFLRSLQARSSSSSTAPRTGQPPATDVVRGMSAFASSSMRP